MKHTIKKPPSDNIATTLVGLENVNSVTFNSNILNEECEGSHSRLEEYRNQMPHINDFYTFCNTCGIDTTIFSHEHHCPGSN